MANVNGFRLLTSNDNATWQPAFSKFRPEQTPVVYDAFTFSALDSAQTPSGQSRNEFTTSEPHHRWSVGGLYDNIESDIAVQDRAWLGSGHGWAGANYVAWNTKGDLVAQQPPTAQNYAIGHVGRKVGGFAPNSQDPRPRQDGWWESLGQNVEPRSLYLRQLTDRLGADAAQRIERTTVGGGALDTPRVESDLPLTTP